MRQRVQKLIDSGVMQIVAVTDPMQIGFARQAMIAISVTGDIEAIADQLAEIDEVDYVVVTAGSFDILAEVVVEDDAHLLRLVNRRIRTIDGVTQTEIVPLPQARQTDLQLGRQMTITRLNRTSSRRRELSWPPRRASTCGCTSPDVVLRRTRRCRRSCAATARASTTPTAAATSTGWPGCSSCRPGTAARNSPRPPTSRPTSWRSSRSGPTPTRRRSSSPTGSPTYAPGDLNKVFFTTGGGEAVETAWKLAKQYFKLIGKPMKTQGHQPRDRLPRHPAGRAVDHRHPGREEVVRAARARRAQGARTPTSTARPSTATTSRRSAAGPPTRSSRRSRCEGPDTVAAVFLEPVQNSGGCFPPPPGYFQRVREICDRHDVLLVSDEVICAFGRLGTMFACDKFGYVPDMITCAKGMTSGYSPIGACLISDRIAEPFWHGDDYFPHGYTFGGHPVSAAVAMANLDIFEREGLNQHVLDNEGAFRATLEKLQRPADRRRRPRRRLLLRHRAGQGQGDQGDLRRRRVRAAAARLPVEGAVRRRAVLPRRRPRRPGRAARPAADLRPARVRRDRADPALGAHRGLGAPLVARRGPRVLGVTTPAELAGRAHRATESLHSMIYFVRARRRELVAVGLRPGRMCYFASRSAPMGAVSAGVTDATFYNFNPELVAKYIPRAWTLADPSRTILAARLRARTRRCAGCSATRRLGGGRRAGRARPHRHRGADARGTPALRRPRRAALARRTAPRAVARRHAAARVPRRRPHHGTGARRAHRSGIDRHAHRHRTRLHRPPPPSSCAAGPTTSGTPPARVWPGAACSRARSCRRPASSCAPTSRPRPTRSTRRHGSCSAPNAPLGSSNSANTCRGRSRRTAPSRPMVCSRGLASRQRDGAGLIPAQTDLAVDRQFGVRFCAIRDQFPAVRLIGVSGLTTSAPMTAEACRHSWGDNR